MSESASLEHLLDRVTLVKGAGDRSRGQLCVMSLAALLAGERHTDAPHAVSPFIRRFAIAINDHLPEQERQRLKLFAPRMIGTNDSYDRDRAQLLLSILSDEIIPALKAERTEDWLGSSAAGRDDDMLAATLQRACRAFAGRQIGEVADCVSSLLTSCAKTAPIQPLRDRCWSRGIDILDRLCSIGGERPMNELPESRIAAAHRKLDKSGQLLVMSECAQTLLAAPMNAMQALVRLWRGPAAKPPPLPADAQTQPASAPQAAARSLYLPVDSQA